MKKMIAVATYFLIEYNILLKGKELKEDDMNKNYQKELDQVLIEEEKQEFTKCLMLHSCCAPCSSYVLEYLSRYFRIIVFYYNPNISPKQEYEKRVEEQKEFIRKLETKHPISFIEGDYAHNVFLENCKGLEGQKEGGERCFRCYEQRMIETAKQGIECGADYFASTLTISPLKNAAKINEIGERIASKYGISHLPSDFKKKGGYKRSVELSNLFGLYRQNYCGCEFSKREASTQ